MIVHLSYKAKTLMKLLMISLNHKVIIFIENIFKITI